MKILDVALAGRKDQQPKIIESCTRRPEHSLFISLTAAYTRKYSITLESASNSFGFNVFFLLFIAATCLDNDEREQSTFSPAYC